MDRNLRTAFRSGAASCYNPRIGKLMKTPRPLKRALAMLRQAQRRVTTDRRGAMMSEYVILVGVVGIVVATAIAGAGPQLLAGYERSRGIVMCPLP
jgi:Flp pilus assembly pilin Flp